MCCIFLLTTYYLSSTAYIDYKLWDVFTVTAADFTVEFSVSKRIWSKFLNTPEASSSDSRAVAFENYLKKHFQEIVTDEAGVLSDEYQDIKIANISFAFSNNEIINLLKKRGKIVMNA
jgi:hypothetical protein